MSTSQPFREFFLKEEISFNNLGEDTLIIFDTNTLLNIYRYSDFTKEKLISAIKKVKNNIWIPYQVGLEFNMNRRVVLREMRDEKDLRISNIKDKLEEYLNSIGNEINQFNLKSTDVQEHKKDAIDYVEKGFKELVDGLSKKLEEINNLMTLDEDLADTIADLFEGKIGVSYSQEELDEKLSSAEKRYEDEIPPGYKDKKRKNGEFEKTFYNGVEFEKRFGDLIVWYQIIDKASEDNIKKVVFVTNDNKADWWYSYKGETIGPRVELKNELLRKANADLIMLNANSFLNNFSETNDLIIIDSQDENNGLQKVYESREGDVLRKRLKESWFNLGITESENSFINAEEIDRARARERQREIELERQLMIARIELDEIERMKGLERDQNRRNDISDSEKIELKKYELREKESELSRQWKNRTLYKLDKQRRDYLLNNRIHEDEESEMIGLTERERREYLRNKYNL